MKLARNARANGRTGRTVAVDGDADRKRAAARSFDDAADAYLTSAVHREGSDLETIAAWCAGASRALDVATGAGHTAGAIAGAGVPRVVATDASPTRVATSEREFAGVEGVVADAERLPFADGSFDAVACRIAAHHFPDPAGFVAEVARVLRPGGTLAFEDNVAPADDELAAFLNRVEGLRDPTHVESHPTSRWIEWLTGAGFSVEATRRIRKPIEFDPWVDAQVDEPDRREGVERLLLDAPAAARDLFEIETEGGEVRSFSNLKVLLRAGLVE